MITDLSSYDSKIEIKFLRKFNSLSWVSGLSGQFHLKFFFYIASWRNNPIGRRAWSPSCRGMNNLFSKSQLVLDAKLPGVLVKTIVSDSLDRPPIIWSAVISSNLPEKFQNLNDKFQFSRIFFFAMLESFYNNVSEHFPQFSFRRPTRILFNILSYKLTIFQTPAAALWHGDPPVLPSIAIEHV